MSRARAGSEGHADIDGLLRAAERARGNAFAPYSNFAVGAAVRTTAGDIFIGCNIESASYGLTICAERVAVFKAVSEGFKRITHIAIVSNADELTPPCGACRQILSEFGLNVEVHLGNSAGRRAVHSLQDLLPHPFSGDILSADRR